MKSNKPERSPEHAKYSAYVPEFWKKVEKQEADAISRGLPAKGITEFGRRWMNAWNTQSLEKLSECMTPDCDFVDSSTFQGIRRGRDLTIANCATVFSVMPDLSFYPQDETNRSLIYFDRIDDEWRMTFPWRGIARWSGAARIPGTRISIPPSGQNINFIGIDRYLVTDDFRIKRIDTDWDMLYAFYQLSPVKAPKFLKSLMESITSQPMVGAKRKYR